MHWISCVNEWPEWIQRTLYSSGGGGNWPSVKLCAPSGRASDGRCFHSSGHSLLSTVFPSISGGYEYSTCISNYHFYFKVTVRPNSVTDFEILTGRREHCWGSVCAAILQYRTSRKIRFNFLFTCRGPNFCSNSVVEDNPTLLRVW